MAAVLVIVVAAVAITAAAVEAAVANAELACQLCRVLWPVLVQVRVESILMGLKL